MHLPGSILSLPWSLLLTYTLIQPRSHLSAQLSGPHSGTPTSIYRLPWSSHTHMQTCLSTYEHAHVCKMVMTQKHTCRHIGMHVHAIDRCTDTCAKHMIDVCRHLYRHVPVCVQTQVIYAHMFSLHTHMPAYVLPSPEPTHLPKRAPPNSPTRPHPPSSRLGSPSLQCSVTHQWTWWAWMTCLTLGASWTLGTKKRGKGDIHGYRDGTLWPGGEVTPRF